MVAEIQTMNRPQALAASTASQSAAPQPATASAGQSKAPEIDHAKLVAPKKVELTLNPDEKEQTLKAALSELNQQMASSKQHLGFHMDESIHGPVITVQNTQTGEVVRQIPSEVVLNIAHSIDSLKGVLFNKKT